MSMNEVRKNRSAVWTQASHFHHPGSQQGSALLIVLGLLSFIVVSAVAFAMYMRVERQASSNYRHTLTARHLLDAALGRAIDEVDSDLRDTSVTPCKFPDNWFCRVRPSAVEDSAYNTYDTRVLSLEALSFVPGILVNDVRRYAVRQPKTDAALADKAYMGAKWRKLYMPVLSMGDADKGRATGASDSETGPQIGRYAYVCVNLSDLPNVNACALQLATTDPVTNRVCLEHLFASSADAQKIDSYKKTDIAYQTVSDFYACLLAHGSTVLTSPLYDWLAGESEGTVKKELNNAIKHVFVTDGEVRREPVRSSAVNIHDQKFWTPGDGISDLQTAVTTLATQLAAVQTLKTVNNATATQTAIEHFKYQLYNYIDEDNVPTFKTGWGVGPLYRPVVEMMPMICGLTLSQTVQKNLLKPSVITEVDATDPANKKTTYKLKLLNVNDERPIYIHCMFPFRNWKSPNKTQSTFTLEGQAYLLLVKGDNPLKTRELYTQDTAGKIWCFPVDLDVLSATDLLPSADDTDNIVKPCGAMLKLNAVDAKLTAGIPFAEQKNSDAPTAVSGSGFDLNVNYRVALVVFAGIKSGGEWTDMVPGYWSPSKPKSTLADILAENPTCDDGDGIMDRLFFETPSFTLKTGVNETPLYTASSDNILPFEWTRLDVPDPRFNYKASNWVVGQLSSGDNGDSRKTISQATIDILGQDGRDSDVFMFSSNQKNIFSPGEFGFLVRPYPDPAGAPANVALASQTDASKAEDADYMFRTVRLYDHGAASGETGTTLGNKSRHDDIYDYFYIEEPDGTTRGVRVNPLSDLPPVLQAAIDATPVDYYWATQSDTTMRFKNVLGTSDWTTFCDAWSAKIRQLQPGINSSWSTRLCKVYGTNAVASSWYTTATYTDSSVRQSIFGVTLHKPLYEIDRKMLYSYSLDSFSDRQQLFLYILRAEAVAPSVGAVSGADAGMRSLAGGRAVALVWRDPYPAGYTFDSDGKEDASNLKPITADNGYLNRTSPWTQYGADGTRGSRSNIHDYRILYFKQLDN